MFLRFPVAHLLLAFLTIHGWMLVREATDNNWQIMTAGVLALLLSLVGPFLSMNLCDGEKKI